MDEGKRHRLIVGIDYGTTYSGISYVTTDKTGIEDINVITSWPGSSSLSAWKTPTCLAYAEENKGQEKDVWGYSVNPNLISCSWTKLLFDNSVTTYDDPTIKSAMDKGILRLPASDPFKKTAHEVCTDYLRCVHAHFMNTVKKQIGESYLETTPMDCWVTVPAVWDDKAQTLTKEAVRDAGFASREDDKIYVVAEPEAAALSVLKGYMKPQAPNSPEKDEGVMICDCGGGTVDITTYRILETTPLLVFEELCEGDGGKCGSTYIDRNLHQLMESRFGDHFRKLEVRKKGPGSRFMNEWDRVKRQFGMDNAGGSNHEIQLVMPKVADSDFYDAEEKMVKLCRADLELLFKPVVDQILALISKQLERVAKEDNEYTIKRLVLVGGFGDSNYLYASVEKWCGNKGIQVLCPNDPQAAIVRGAALRGLEGVAPRNRRCRRHYGFSLPQPFRQGRDPESKAYTEQYGKETRKLCLRRMHWLVHKGEKIVQNDRRSSQHHFLWDRSRAKTGTINLFSCALDDAPEYSDDRRVEKIGTVTVDFSTTPKWYFENKRDHGWYGTKRYDFEFEIEIAFGGSSSNLEVRTMVMDEVTGEAKLTFD